MSHQVTAVFLCDCYPQYQQQSQCTVCHCGRLELPVLRRPVGQHSLFLVSSGASVGYLRVSSFFEPWLVRLSAAKSWVLAEASSTLFKVHLLINKWPTDVTTESNRIDVWRLPNRPALILLRIALSLLLQQWWCVRWQLAGRSTSVVISSPTSR